MIVVMSKDKNMLVECVGVFVEESKDEFDHRVTVQGILATVGTPIELGRYEGEIAIKVVEEIRKRYQRYNEYQQIYTMP